jgi:hypothetical protein
MKLGARRRDLDGNCVMRRKHYKEHETRLLAKTGLETVEAVRIEYGVE